MSRCETAALHRAYRTLSLYFRRRRFKKFSKILQPGSGTKILDVGGYPGTWNCVECPASITILNLEVSPDAQENSLYPLLAGDGRNLHQFKNLAFDIVFSNSVIEHLGTFEDQQRFASEMRRVGQRLWIQTPARGFFIEPHYITAFVHYLPKRWQRRLLRSLSLWGWLTKPNAAQIEALLQEIRLLNGPEMRQLFPDCRIIKERFMGFTKSFIAVR